MSRNRPRATNNLPAGRYQGRASFPAEPPPKEQRKLTAEETLTLVPSVLHQASISPESALTTFHASQLPQLDPAACPDYVPPPIEVQYGDTFTVTRALLTSRPDYTGKIAVLNCASDVELAGGWRHRFGTTQEDALCYSSTLWPTLEPHKEKYPWRKVVDWEVNESGCAGLWSPDVVVFRDELSKGCKILKRREWVSVGVVSVAALACPALVPAEGRRGKEGEMRLKMEKDVVTIRERIKMCLRMVATNGKSVLVLAAFGCGVWKCPSKQVAELFKECLEDAEFTRWFEKVLFGIYDHEVEKAFSKVF